MSRYVMFSFDDGRADTYQIAVPILRRYGLTATINVVTDFIRHPEQYAFSGNNGCAMRQEELKDCQKTGIELACHGSTHKNTVEDIQKNIEELQEMGISVDHIGFASPCSELTKKNSASIQALVTQGTLAYIRSGIQVRREGLLYAAATALERRSHSRRLFWLLNRKSILSSRTNTILLSVTVTRATTLAQIEYLLSRLQDGEGVIFNFHSLAYQTDYENSKGNWCWMAERFDDLCANLAKDIRFCVCTTKAFVCAEMDSNLPDK